jgi:hypothetical protein
MFFKISAESFANTRQNHADTENVPANTYAASFVLPFSFILAC